MSSTQMNRRGILAGTASLPALSIPALAAENPELLAIGEKIKALWPAYQEACARSHELYEATRELAGWNDPEREQAVRDRLDHEQDTARWNAAAEKTGYSAAAGRMNAVSACIWPLAEAASELKATPQQAMACWPWRRSFRTTSAAGLRRTTS
jgi:hypothetical protein